MLLNADLISIKTATVSRSLIKPMWILVIRIIRLPWQDLNFLKPNWLFGKRRGNIADGDSAS